MEWESREQVGPAAARGGVACPQCGGTYGEEARFCPADGSKLAAEPEDPLVGQLLLGQIRIEERLAEGGMGVVYRARQIGLDRPIALKVLHRALSFDPEARRRFEREARICARIDHPNVVRILLSGHLPDGHPFLAMELLEGRTLDRLLREGGPLAPSRAAAVLKRICAGVGAAHALGIVHRDLKPDNVVVGAGDERVKVLDFGVARMLEGSDGTPTRSGLVFGTARYISPEGALGERTDPRSDVYSLGVMAYQMLSGRLPFEGPTSVAVLLKHAHEPVPPIEAPAGGPPIPEALAGAVMRALAKRPEDRYPDAGAFARAIGCVEAPEPSREPAAHAGAGRPGRSEVTLRLPRPAEMKASA